MCKKEGRLEVCPESVAINFCKVTHAVFGKNQDFESVCIIAAPTIANLAALFGALFVRISSSTDPDMGPLLLEGKHARHNLTHGLKSLSSKETLKSVFKDCDVFLDGYLPGVMERLVFGPEEVRISEEHGKGITYVRDNFCRWKGPLAYRSG